MPPERPSDSISPQASGQASGTPPPAYSLPQASGQASGTPPPAYNLGTLPELPTVEDFVKQTKLPWYKEAYKAAYKAASKVLHRGGGDREEWQEWQAWQAVKDGLGAYEVNRNQHTTLAAEARRPNVDPSELDAAGQVAGKAFEMAYQDFRGVKDSLERWQKMQKDNPFGTKISSTTSKFKLTGRNFNGAITKLDNLLKDAAKTFQHPRTDLDAPLGKPARNSLENVSTLKFVMPGLGEVNRLHDASPQDDSSPVRRPQRREGSTRPFLTDQRADQRAPLEKQNQNQNQAQVMRSVFRI